MFHFFVCFSDHIVKIVLPSGMNICWSTQTKTQLEIKHKLKDESFSALFKRRLKCKLFRTTVKIFDEIVNKKILKFRIPVLYQLPFSRKRNFFEFFPISKTFIIKKLLLKKIDEQSKFTKKKKNSKNLIFHFSYSTFLFVVNTCFF
jgi:hypothetical protein